MKRITFLVLLGLIIGTGAAKSQYQVLYNFERTTGCIPQSDVSILGSVLYGVTTRGGIADSGVVFSFDTSGKIYRELHDFSNLTGGGATPRYGSLRKIGNKLFGTTEFEGKHNAGIAFSINTDGTGYKDILDFDNSNSPYGTGVFSGLILFDNKLYGMTRLGGPSSSVGVVYCIDTAGSYENVFNFSGGSNGKEPYGEVTINGNKLYGMTSAGGIYGYGNIFSMDTSGAGYVDLLDFNGANGNTPSGNLTFSGNKLYGMTDAGGAHNDGLIFSLDTDGSVYKDLLDFDGSNGQTPNGSLILFKGVLYGMTYGGGTHNFGCIFSIDTNGSNYRDLVDFSDSIGINPFGSLTLSGDMLFGTTYNGGTNGGGVIFCFKDTAIKIEDAINNIKSTETINVYPSPNKGQLNITVNELNNRVEFYNVLGEEIYSGSLLNGTNNINLGKVPAGVYLYKIISANNTTVSLGKFVIE